MKYNYINFKLVYLIQLLNILYKEITHLYLFYLNQNYYFIIIIFYKLLIILSKSLIKLDYCYRQLINRWNILAHCVWDR